MRNAAVMRSLTFIHPGLGHLYAGRHRDALFYAGIPFKDRYFQRR
ncbi:hypothetical protein [Cohnella soli]|uniref:Uncharacterized protein n=1 Tax=Cohnella soli TaxID=425005 RepID=A0ABW0HNX8_9BACL